METQFSQLFASWAPLLSIGSDQTHGWMGAGQLGMANGPYKRLRSIGLKILYAGCIWASPTVNRR